MSAPTTTSLTSTAGYLARADGLIKNAVVTVASGIEGGGHLDTDLQSLRLLVSEIAKTAELIELARMDLERIERDASEEEQ